MASLMYYMAVVQNQWYHFGVGAPPILEPILVGVGMFTGGTIWLLTHGHIYIYIYMYAPKKDLGSGAQV